MNNAERKKIEQIERLLENVLTLIRDIQYPITEDHAEVERLSYNGEAGVARCQELGRQDAEAYLATLKHTELGAIFISAGGSATDKKKPKQWLIEKILWHMFDFEAGHQAIRGIGSHNA